MADVRKRRKPTGKTGPLTADSDGLHRRHFVEFPQAKSEIELFIARLFCAGNAGMRPQITRYGPFSELALQREDSVDLKVQTRLGARWLELTEFAPLDEFGGLHGNVPGRWSVERLTALVVGLIHKKAARHYGAGVILIIYKTQETLFVPPPILRAIRGMLVDPPFESIYFLSPHDQESASVWEIWPGDSSDDGPIVGSGFVHVGFGVLK